MLVPFENTFDVPDTCADEMIIGYVEVMTKMDKKLTEHDKFYGGDAKEIRRRLIETKQAAGPSAGIALCAYACHRAWGRSLKVWACEGAGVNIARSVEMQSALCTCLGCAK